MTSAPSSPPAPAVKANPYNPPLLILSRITHDVTERTTWGHWATGTYAQRFSLTEIEEIANQVSSLGFAHVGELTLIDVTPNETEVARWVRDQAATADMAGRVDSFRLGVSSYSDGEPFSCTGYKAGTFEMKSVFGRTVAEAVGRFRDLMPTGEALAAQKRAEAARLLAEADAIVAQKGDAAA